MNKLSIPDGHTFQDYYVLFKRARSEDTLETMVKKQIRDVTKAYPEESNGDLANRIKLEIYRAENMRQNDFSTDKNAVDAQIKVIQRKSVIDTASERYDPQKEFAKMLNAIGTHD